MSSPLQPRTSNYALFDLYRWCCCPYSLLFHQAPRQRIREAAGLSLAQTELSFLSNSMNIDGIPLGPMAVEAIAEL